MKSSDDKLTDFLSSQTSKITAYILQTFIKLITALPFLLSLFYYTENKFSALLLALAFVPFSSPSIKMKHLVLPTPFAQFPFEFIVGFRKSFVFFIMAYFLSVAGVVVHNSNLALFSIALVFMTCINYYSVVEDEFHVWVFSLTPRQFLNQKLYAALRNAIVLVLPILIISLPFFFLDFLYFLLMVFVSALFLASIVFAKYSAYPNNMHLLSGLSIALCLSFPPILILILPYFYKKAIQSLSNYLR
jgi:hypothetical protein